MEPHLFFPCPQLHLIPRDPHCAFVFNGEECGEEPDAEIHKIAEAA